MKSLLILSELVKNRLVNVSFLIIPYYFRQVEIAQLLKGIKSGDRRSIARAITWVENDQPGYETLLHSLQFTRNTPVIGITGPPGAGKSTLINALIKLICSKTNVEGHPNTVGVIAVDPSSPFTHGSLLGDRLRMQEHFTNPQVFIRSLATRGALGGLSAKTLEICDVLRASTFNYIFIETVGVGQSEVEIIGLADTVVVTLVPEAGDEIQALKSGIMEIGDIFVVNKMDRAGSDLFAAGIIKTLHERPAHGDWVIPVLKTNASAYEGIEKLLESIHAHSKTATANHRLSLIAERAYRLIQHGRMKDVSVKELKDQLKSVYENEDFNLYRFVKKLI